MWQRGPFQPQPKTQTEPQKLHPWPPVFITSCFPSNMNQCLLLRWATLCISSSNVYRNAKTNQSENQEFILMTIGGTLLSCEKIMNEIFFTSQTVLPNPSCHFFSVILYSQNVNVEEYLGCRGSIIYTRGLSEIINKEWVHDESKQLTSWTLDAVQFTGSRFTLWRLICIASISRVASELRRHQVCVPRLQRRGWNAEL